MRNGRSNNQRGWWEDEPDIRVSERFSEALIDAFSGMRSVGYVSSKPFGAERRAARQARTEAYAKKRRIKRRIQQSFSHLMKAQFIAEDRGQIHLTLKGWGRYLLNYSRALKKEKKRHGKASKRWYIVIFDIPEDFRHFRNAFRRTLYALGFSMLQRSVFITHDQKGFDFIGKVISQTELFDRVKLIIGDQVL